MKIVASEDHRLHAPAVELGLGQLQPIFEKPERAEIVLNSVLKHGLGQLIEPRQFDDEAMLAVHDQDYLEFLRTAYTEFTKLGVDGQPFPSVWPRGKMRDNSSDSIVAKLGRYCFDGCVPFTESTYKAIIASRDIALTAASMVQAGERSAFALCRPPGHHAGPGYAGGYCFLNNVAIAAQWLRNAGANRVAILDIDYHHGNGTQEIFYERADVAVTSIHGDPKFEYPFYAGHADEVGNGEGTAYNLNLPLPAGTEYNAWNNALASSLTFIKDYAPDYLVVSMGMDTFIDDPISSFRLTIENYRSIGATIAQQALPTIFVFEGGYAVAELGENAAALLLGFESRV